MTSGAMWQVARATSGAFAYGLLRMRRSGVENIPATGPVLIACNHVAIFDPPCMLVAATPRRVHPMTMAELFGNPVLAGMLRRIGAFPVRRAYPDTWAIRAGRALLARGECVLTFPEGGVKRNGDLNPGFSGTGYLALREGVTVIPAAIWDTQLLRGPVRVRFGEPVPMDDLRASPRPGRNRRTTDRIMAALAQLLPDVGGPAQAPPTGAPFLPRAARRTS